MTADQRTAHDELLEAAYSGTLSRRELIRRGAALGLTASALGAILAACGTSATPTAAPSTAASAAPTTAASTAPTTAASVAPTAATGGAATARPATATTGAASSVAPTAVAGKRGGGGTAKVLWWQGPAVINPHLASGTKDYDASRVVYEPLCTFDGSEKLIPVLAAELPTAENGGLAADGKSVTWKLKQGVKWSDGQPFNADDVIFTWQYVTDPQTGAVTAGIYQNIAAIDKVDDYTVKITFKGGDAGLVHRLQRDQWLCHPEARFQ